MADKRLQDKISFHGVILSVQPRSNFSNGDVTDLASPLGPINDGMSNVSIETKIKDRKVEIGEKMVLVYDYSGDWRKKVKLDGIE